MSFSRSSERQQGVRISYLGWQTVPGAHHRDRERSVAKCDTSSWHDQLCISFTFPDFVRFLAVAAKITEVQCSVVIYETVCFAQKRGYWWWWRGSESGGESRTREAETTTEQRPRTVCLSNEFMWSLCLWCGLFLAFCLLPWFID